LAFAAVQRRDQPALNQTLSRTLITSGTVFLATLSLFLFGGGVINDFGVHLPGRHHHRHLFEHLHRHALVLWWHKGERPKPHPR